MLIIVNPFDIITKKSLFLLIFLLFNQFLRSSIDLFFYILPISVSLFLFHFKYIQFYNSRNSYFKCSPIDREMIQTNSKMRHTWYLIMARRHTPTLILLLKPNNGSQSDEIESYYELYCCLYGRFGLCFDNSHPSISLQSDECVWYWRRVDILWILRNSGYEYFLSSGL